MGMELKDLREYLSMVLDMEENKFLQENAKAQLNSKISSLCIPKKFRGNVSSVNSGSPALGNANQKPISKEFDGSDIEENRRHLLEDNSKRLKQSLYPFLITVGVAIVTTIIYVIGVAANSDMMIILFGLLCIGSIGLSIKFLVDLFKDYLFASGEKRRINDSCDERLRLSRKQHDEQYQNYVQESKKLTAFMNEEKKRLYAEGAQRYYLYKQVSAIDKILNDTIKSLNKAYALNVIFPKYRNRNCIAMLNEYVQSGRCTTLEGHEGAYNLLESEIRMNSIISRLDTVISQLSNIGGHLAAIERGQQMMYMALQSIDSKASLIHKEALKTYEMQSNINSNIQNVNASVIQGNNAVKSLNDNVELLAYKQERVARELEYANRINYLAGRNNVSVFDNRPPHMQ